MSPDDAIELVTKLFEAFTRRDADAILNVVSTDVEFHAPTADIARRGRPYVGAAGMRDYLADVARVWRELRAIPQTFREHDGCVLATGRVYARDHEGSVIDSPAGWLFRVREERVVSGRVYERAEDAVAAFDALSRAER